MTDAALVDLERRLRERAIELERPSVLGCAGEVMVSGTDFGAWQILTHAADALASLRSERTQLQGLIRKWRAKDAEQTRWYQAADQLEAVLSEGRPSSGEGAHNHAESPLSLDRLIVVTCHCGMQMQPVMGDMDELLYMCPSDECPQQVNVMTIAKYAALDSSTPRSTEP